MAKMAKKKSTLPEVKELTILTPSINEVLNETQQRSNAPRAHAFPVQHPTWVGEIRETAAANSAGRVLVRWVEEKDLVQERWLAVVRGVELKQGDKVLLQRPTNWPDWVVMGALESESNPDATRQVMAKRIETEKEKEKETEEKKMVDLKIDGRRIEIEGQEEVVLRCGQASITLRRNGRVVIRGAYVETRAKGTNRIKGGSVLIN